MELDKILIIDGNFILNRSFYVSKNLNNTDNNMAIYIFLKIYYKFHNIISPIKTFICFDKSSCTFRRRLYSNYKINRQKMPNELFDQLILLKEILKLMNIKIFELENFEADDIIGSLCFKFKKYNKCFILSGDKDLFQLIDNNVKIYYINTINKISQTIIYDESFFLKKYNFKSKYFVDYKALVGDVSDNIPGVYGIGCVTATKIISQFNTIDNLYDNIHTININEILKKKLIVNKEKAYLSYFLSKIKTDINIYIDNHNTFDKIKLYNLFEQFKFKSLLSKLL